MSNRKLLALAAALALVVPAAAHAMLADVPLEIIAARSELVVVADVVKTNPPAMIALNVPDSPKPVNTWFMKCTLRITRVITENGKPPAAGDAKPANRTIEIFTRAPRPAQPGQPRIAVSDMYYASLQAGKGYVLLLRKMAGRAEYYLPSYPRNSAPAGAEEIKKIERAALVAKWAWGKAVGGLQIALVPRQTRVQLRQIRRHVRGKDGRMRPQFQGKSASVPCVVALRNVAKEPVAVNLYAGDRLLSVVAKGPGGKTVKPDLYGWLARADLALFSPKYTAIIKPGAVLFIGPTGKGDYGMSLNLDVATGKWRLQASYTCARQAAGVGGRKLWTGTIQSAPAEIEVTNPPKGR